MDEYPEDNRIIVFPVLETCTNHDIICKCYIYDLDDNEFRVQTIEMSNFRSLYPPQTTLLCNSDRGVLSYFNDYFVIRVYGINPSDLDSFKRRLIKDEDFKNDDPPKRVHRGFPLLATKRGFRTEYHLYDSELDFMNPKVVQNNLIVTTARLNDVRYQWILGQISYARFKLIFRDGPSIQLWSLPIIHRALSTCVLPSRFVLEMYKQIPEFAEQDDESLRKTFKIPNEVYVQFICGKGFARVDHSPR